MSQETRFPDIEIYIADLPIEEIINWLAATLSLESTTPEEQGTTLKLRADHAGNSIPVTLTPQAAGKRFTSVIFDSSHTPWYNDLECARAAVTDLETEVRCSASGWQEEESEEQEHWWRLTKEGEELIKWGG